MYWYVPNMGYQENHLPHYQQKLGHDVQIITSDRFPLLPGYRNHIGKYNDSRIVGSGLFEDNGIKIHRLPARLEIVDGGQLFLSGIQQAIKEIHPDVVHVHGGFSILALQILSYNQEYKIFIDDHSHKDALNLNSFAKKIAVLVIRTLINSRIDKVNCWLPVTMASRELLQHHLQIQEDRVQLLPLGVDTKKFNMSNSLRESVRYNLGIKADEILLIFTGKIEEKKRLDLLIRAAINIHKNNEKLKLLIIGDGVTDTVAALSSLIKSYKGNDFVKWIEFQSNDKLPAYYNASDIGIWPGSPSISTIEALATGLPIVVPKEDLAYKIVLDNAAAYGYQGGDVVSLEKSILDIINNPNLREQLKNNSIDLVSTTLSWEKIAERSIEIYQDF